MVFWKQLLELEEVFFFYHHPFLLGAEVDLCAEEKRLGVTLALNVHSKPRGGWNSVDSATDVYMYVTVLFHGVPSPG